MKSELELTVNESRKFRSTVIVAEDLTILFWDEPATKLLGYSHEQTTGMNIDKIIPLSTALPDVVVPVSGKHQSGAMIPLFVKKHHVYRGYETICVIELTPRGAHAEKSEPEDIRSLLGLYDDLMAAAVLVDSDGKIKQYNAVFKDWISDTRDSLVGMEFKQLLDPRKSDDVWSELLQIQQQEDFTGYTEFALIPSYGGRIHTSARISFFEFDKNEFPYSLLVLFDRTDFHVLENELANRERFIRAVLQSSPIVFYIFDLKERKCTYSNQGIKRILGYSELGGVEVREGFFPSLIHPDDKVLIENYHKRIKESFLDEIYEIKYRVKAADGSNHWMFSKDSVLKRSVNGEVIQIVGTAQDITEEVRAQEEIKALNISLEDRVRRRTEELREANKELRRLATTDFLTGVMNRRFFLSRLEEEASRCARYGNTMTFAMMDLDHFKHVNDQYGHASGDKVLIAFVKEVARTLRRTDFMGRLGGEEFGIIFVETSARSATIVAERIRQLIENLPITLDGNQVIHVTASIGLADSTGKTDIDLLQKQADEACYESKRSGRNCVTVWRQEFSLLEESQD